MPAAEVTFSVVVPLYNKSAFVRPTLETVLAQRYRPVEVIVVDDGSTDGSVEAIADLVEERVRVVRQSNAGPGPARNHGAALACGEWIALIDADDRWHPDHLKNLACVIAAFPDVDVVATASRWQSAATVDDRLPLLADPRPRRLDYFTNVEENVVHTSSVAIRRTAWLAGDGFGAFIPGEDVEFWVRLALDHAFAVSPIPTSIYVRDNGGIMVNDDSATRPGPAEPGPLNFLLDRVLTDERYCDRWKDIEGFFDRKLLNSVKNMLFVGNVVSARDILSRLRRRWSPKAMAYLAASYAPAKTLRTAIMGYSLLRKFLRA